MLGMADLGIASRNDMVRNADMIANLDSHNFELIADMDTGYGGKLSRTLQLGNFGPNPFTLLPSHTVQVPSLLITYPLLQAP